MGNFDEYLVSGELLLYEAESKEGVLGCTNKRLICTYGQNFEDIDYTHINSVEFSEKDYPILSTLGLLLFFIGMIIFVFHESSRLAALFIGSSLLFIYLFLRSKKSGLIIHTEKDSKVYSFYGADSRKAAIEVSKKIRQNYKN